MIPETNDVYAFFSSFIPFGAGNLLTKIHLEIIFTIKAAVIVKDDLDHCGYSDNSFNFYKSCYDIIVEKKILRFEFANYINILFC